MRNSLLPKLSLIAATLMLSGCAGNTDLGKQIATNQQVRDQAMSAIAGNADLAVVMQQKLLANDSLRTRLVDTVLQDANASQYVLYRIATNQAAMDLVLRGAVADSSMRQHVLTLMKGVEMAQNGKK